MKAHTPVLAILAIVGAATAGAQPLARADVTGVAGWFNANKPEAASYNNWYHRSAYGGLVLGWYWTDHLKSEIEWGLTSPAELSTPQTLEIEGRQAYGNSRHRFTTRRLTAGHQYQFFRNAWAHPHIAGGAAVTWNTDSQRDDQIVFFDQMTRTTRVLRPAQTRGPSTALEIRPFVELGTKLYLSQRGFFRTDLRLTFGSRVDDVLVRFGLGVDF